jgi:serine/threonine protein kinase
MPTETRSADSCRQLRAFLLAALGGVAELHRENVVHRDLKFENVILLNGDWTQPVTIDLGLSRLIGLASVTVYPWAGGTWLYMAPEQLHGDRAFDRAGRSRSGDTSGGTVP